MKIVNKKRFEIGINWSGHTYWKPEWCGGLDNYHRVNNGKDFKFINTWSYFIQTTITWHFLRFVFYIQIKPELISGDRPIKYVKFEDTHLPLMDIKEGNWDD